MNILHGTMSQPVNRPEPYFYDRVVYTTTGAVVDIEDFENRPLYPETVSISGVSTITETGTYTFTNDINVDSFTEPIKSVTWTNADKIDNNSASITVNSLPSADQTVTISCVIEFEKGYTKTISKQVTIVEGPYTPSISSMTIDGTSIASGDTLSASGLSSFSATISEYRSNHTVSILLKQSGETVLTLGTFASTSVSTTNSTMLEDGSYNIVFVVDGDSTEYATVIIEDYEPVHEVEIWADAACTTRPVVGNEYRTLYAQVNINVGFNLIKTYNNGECEVYAPTEENPGDPYGVAIYSFIFNSIYNIVDGLHKGQIVECGFSGPQDYTWRFEEGLSVSFGDLV